MIRRTARGRMPQSRSTRQPGAAETWREALFNRRMLICVFTGFSSGLPLYLLINLLPAWLRTEGRRPEDDRPLRADPAALHLEVPLVAADRPLRAAAARAAGAAGCWRRRSRCSCRFRCSACCIRSATSGRSPRSSTAVAFFSASQDIVLDAYRREILPDAELGLGNVDPRQRLPDLEPRARRAGADPRRPDAVVVASSRSPRCSCCRASRMTLVVREPALLAGSAADAARGGRRAVPRIHHARRLARRRCWCWRSSSSTSSATAWRPRWPRRSTSTWASPRPTSALIAKNAGLWASVIGGLLGGLWMVKIGINRALWLFGVVQVVSILGFAWLACGAAGPDHRGCSAA